MTDEQRTRDLEHELESERKAVNKMENKIQELENRFEKYVSDQKELENRRMRTALLWAGSVILILGSFIFNEIIWPVIRAGKS